ncbi:serine--tRNA ligase [Spirochaeta cellobiosiphila]|uniref:serine--tRNA ligase n=1 Tax=Spirochaeta cellobiosiphila TaxID=504483 RepID=UPI0004177D4B|nr:serine--tRNA ligase [Spirochaeta cellobiosiphila]
MLDLKFIKENIDAVKANIQARNMSADADKVVELYDKRNDSLGKIEDLRQQRNQNAAKMKQKLSTEERQVLIDQGKELKEIIAKEEEALNELESKLQQAARMIPNMAHPEAPVGKEDKDNTEIKRVGTIPDFDFTPKDHVELAEALDIIDFETGTKVSGTKFYYLKNEGALLEMALSRYAMDKLRQKGFTLTITPDIAKEEILEGIGFNPRGEESNIYPLEGTGTCLVGTAEITLGGYYSDQIVDLTNGPILMAGLSHCFRREAGAAGQYSKGLYRVHQFSKVEMFVLCKPEESDALHETLREIEEEIFSDLEIPFRVVDTCTGDLGAPAYRKYDLEAWMPGRGEKGDWGEITSTSNCTDYQSRRLKVRYKEDKKTKFVHMLNGTAIAISRAIISVLENCQNADGSVSIPTKLQPYTGFDKIAR